MASQITAVSSVCSTVCSGADQRKHQSSAPLAFVRGIHRWPVTCVFVSERSSNAENVFIWYRDHGLLHKGVQQRDDGSHEYVFSWCDVKKADVTRFGLIFTHLHTRYLKLIRRTTNQREQMKYLVMFKSHDCTDPNQTQLSLCFAVCPLP